MADIKKREVNEIILFVASGAETAEYRDKLQIALNEFNEVNENTDIYFRLLRWEYASAALPASGHSQDVYDAEFDKCQMLIVIIKNTLGKYTRHEL
ncbi:hypothetical protein [Lactovum odontotermitis]